MATLLNVKSEALLGKDFTTYRMGGVMDEVYQPTTQAEALAVLAYQQESQKPLTILGWGGNTIIAAAGIRGITLLTRKMTWSTLLSDTTFEFGAGVHLAKAASEALKAGLTGAEYMIGIPGTIGGAIFMNAGALQQETADVLQSAQVYDRLTGQVNTWSKSDFQFTYRHCALVPGQHVVLSGVFQFQSGDAAVIKDRMDASVAFRKSHHPTEPNGGSVFKNPSPEQPVGKLLEALGAKTWTEGGVAISPKHANFIINTGHGTAQDILTLMLRMKQAVFEHYQLQIFPENKLLGDINPDEQALWQQLQQTLS